MRSSVGALLVRVIGSVLQLVLAVLLARWAGAALLGQFLVFVAVTNLAVSVGSGLVNLMLRTASTSSSDPRTGWLWRDTLVLVALSAVVSVLAALVGSEYVGLVALGLGLLLLQRVSAGPVKAAQRPSLGVILDTTVWPLLVTAQIGLFQVWAVELTFRWLIWGYLTGLLVAAVIGVAVGWRLPASIRSAVRRQPGPSLAHYREVLVVTIGGLTRAVALNAPLTMAPLFLTDASVGRLGLALRVAGFATTIQATLTSYFSPLFVRARTRGELRTHRLHAQVASVVFYLPVFVLALLLPSDWLEALGADFVQVEVLVVILAVGFLMAAVTGLSSQLLLMRGRSRLYSRIGTVTAVSTVLGVGIGAATGGEVGLCVGLSVVTIGLNVWGYLEAEKTVRSMPVSAPTPEPVLDSDTAPSRAHAARQAGDAAAS